MNKRNFKKPELLAPAGSLEKMKIAFEFGADAVYFGLPDFSLRVRINQFSREDIIEAAKYCREINKKFYVTLNIYAHQRHLKQLPEYLDLLSEVEPDGVIVSDPGILNVIKERLPKQEVHLSTQANATNSEAVKFWSKQGIERIILARETTLEEIEEIKNELPDVELEYFVHGAMCMSYSGRCILSKWMTDRGANLGDCAQPCRWKYKKAKNMSVIDDKERFEIELEEDAHGTYFFNSYDLCLIDHVGKLISAGVDSLKIEGRAKSVYYLAVVIRAYRKVIDAREQLEKGEITSEEYDSIVAHQKNNLNKLTNRGYSTGFLLGDEPKHLLDIASKDSEWEFVGISGDKEDSKIRKVFVHNVLKNGDEVVAVSCDEDVSIEVESIMDGEKMIESAHGGQNKVFVVEFDKKVDGVFLLQKKSISVE